MGALVCPSQWGLFLSLTVSLSGATDQHKFQSKTVTGTQWITTVTFLSFRAGSTFRRFCILTKRLLHFHSHYSLTSPSSIFSVFTLSLYSSFIMQQLKKVGGSWGGMLRTLVTVWLLWGGTKSPVPNKMSLVWTLRLFWAINVCFSHRYSLGVTVLDDSLKTSTETPMASPA